MSPNQDHATTVYHALGLHMHQPPNNLRVLIESNEWEARQIIHCYDRVPRYAKRFEDVARLHVGFSGILLEQLRSPEIIDRYRDILDIPAMLNAYREARNIEIIGMGYYHPIFPLIPREDWRDQLDMGKQIAADVFGRVPRGFWPPEMAFDMEMIPALADAGYTYVIVDGVHVKQSPDAAEPLNPYRHYVARRADANIAVIARDRDISNAQESGLDAAWFDDEVSRRVRPTPGQNAPNLVTTWSDGENGGWFRQMHEEAGFFGHFFAPYMERVRSGATAIRPILIGDFMGQATVSGEAHVQTGAWNVAQTSGYDFTQWAGSRSQREALEKIFAVSRRYRKLARSAVPDEVRRELLEAHRLVLEGETSCFLFWGDEWVPQLYERTARAEALLGTVESAAGLSG